MVQPKKRVTILDIAKAVGVTDGTVSRALSNDPRVRPETRERVTEAARALGYRPNLAARYFKQGQTRTLGVILESGYWFFYNPYFGRLVAGLADAARENDRRLTFFFPEIEPAADRNPAHDVVRPRGLDEVFDGRVDGAVMFAGRKLDPETLRELAEAPVPVVLANTNMPVPGFFQLVSGASQRAKAAALALLDHGHRKIGMVSLYTDTPYEWACLKGLQEAHDARSLDFLPSQIVALEHWDNLNPEAITAVLDKLLAQGVTGIIFSDAGQAVLGLELLKARGLRVPQDLSMLAFGPLPPVARLQEPAVTLFNADLIGAGRELYMMMKEAGEQKEPRSFEIQWSLSEGGTLAPPKRA